MPHEHGKTKNAAGKRQLVKLVVLSIAPFRGDSLESAPALRQHHPTSLQPQPQFQHRLPTHLITSPAAPHQSQSRSIPTDRLAFAWPAQVDRRVVRVGWWIWIPVEKCGTSPGGSFRFARTAGSFAVVLSMICTLTRGAGLPWPGLDRPGEHNSKKGAASSSIVRQECANGQNKG